MRVRLLAATAIAPSLWGTTYVVTTELLPEGRPLLAAALRALPAGLAVLAITRTLPTGSWWWRSAVLGLLNFAAFFSFLFTAAYRLPGGVAATIGAVQPLIVMALAARVLDERAGPARYTAALVGVTGVALLVLDGGARLDAVGVAAALCGAASMAIGGSLVAPGTLGRRQALAHAGRRAAPVVMGAMAMFGIAGLIEGFFRQLVSDLPTRLALAALTALLWAAWLGLGGRMTRERA